MNTRFNNLKKIIFGLIIITITFAQGPLVADPGIQDTGVLEVLHVLHPLMSPDLTSEEKEEYFSSPCPPSKDDDEGKYTPNFIKRNWKKFQTWKEENPEKFARRLWWGGALTVAGTTIAIAVSTGGTSLLVTGLIVGISFGIAGWNAGRKPSNAPLLAKITLYEEAILQLTTLNNALNSTVKKLSNPSAAAG